MYDVIIIGAGPAGITAAIYAARKNLSTLLVSKDLGGQAAISGSIENYLGYSLISGPELAAKFRDHLAEFSQNCTLIEGAEVINLGKTTSLPFDFEVETADPSAGSGQVKKYLGKTVIIASGREPKLLGVTGEKEFLGKGVSTCATCDAPLFRGKTVAVVGGGNSAMDSAYTLTKIATKIYILNMNPALTGDEILKNQVLTATNISHIGNAKTLKILGNSKVTGLEYQDMMGGETKNLAVDGIFIEIGYIPATTFDHLTEKDDRGQIKVNSDLETSIPGLFAAGDVNNLWGEQIVIAAGEGAKAALKAADYLARSPKTNPHQN